MMGGPDRCAGPQVPQEVLVGDRSRDAVKLILAGKHVFEQNARHTA